MKAIEFETKLFRASTYGKGVEQPKGPTIVDSFGLVAGEKAAIGIRSHDELPLFFAAPGILGAAKITPAMALDETFLNDLHAAMTQRNLKPEEIEVYMGPCLTFSHTRVERKTIETLMGKGYRAACKRTDGIDFLDVPVLVLMQCRRLGIPMAQIHIGDYDTFENPDLLYSELRGDKANNLTIATLK